MTPTRRLLAYVGRYRTAFTLGSLCIVATTAISLAGPWVLKYAIDDLTARVTAAKLAFYGAPSSAWRLSVESSASFSGASSSVRHAISSSISATTSSRGSNSSNPRISTVTGPAI